jgi:hypothetical protein
MCRQASRTLHPGQIRLLAARHLVVGVEDVALRAVLAEAAQLIALEAGKRCARVGRVQDPFEVGAVELIEMGEDGVEPAFEPVASLLAPGKGRAGRISDVRSAWLLVGFSRDGNDSTVGRRAQVEP